MTSSSPWEAPKSSDRGEITTPRGTHGRAPRARWIAVALLGAATSLTASSTEAPFLAENDAAMRKMMAAMAITPTGDVDADFVATMVPHHQGAIDMARAELRYGHNEQLRRLAQEIIVEQTDEIGAMRLAVGRPLTTGSRAVRGNGGLR
jgi:DUF305 family protein family protein